jgi:hypothetical protein
MNIKKTTFRLSQLLSLCATGALFCLPAKAEPVWHCSRTDVQVANAADNFTLAALDVEREVMRISIRDLYAAYQGTPVKASGLQVSACFIGGKDDPTTQKAMQSIGADTKTLEQLSRQSIRSRIYQVRDETEMLTCMSKHYPAIGYFSKPQHHDAVGPCF